MNSPSVKAGRIAPRAFFLIPKTGTAVPAPPGGCEDEMS